MSDDFVSNVEELVKAGDKMTVRIVSVDADKGQIAVTARSEEAEKAAEEPRTAGAEAEEDVAGSVPAGPAATARRSRRRSSPSSTPG